MKRCPECGERMYGLSVKRRVALWLRRHLEALAVAVDRWTVEPFDPAKHHPLHLTDEEWAAIEDPA